MRLEEILKERMEMEGLSLRSAAEKIGTSHSTVARAVNGETLDVDSMKKICDWLGVTIDDVLDVKEEQEDIYRQIAAVISIEPEFERVFQEIFDGIENGSLSKEVLREVAAFASYRVALGKKEEVKEEVAEKVSVPAEA